MPVEVVGSRSGPGADQQGDEKTMDDKANALTLYQKIGDPIAAADKLGGWFQASGLFGIQKKEQGVMLALTCMIKGLDPIEVAQKFHIIEGRLAKKAATIQAEFQARGGRINWIERTGKVCEALFLHPQFSPKGVRIRVDLQDDLKHLSNKNNYKQWPRRMLHARCISEGVTAVDPEVMVGFITPEELSDVLDRDLGAIDAEARVVEPTSADEKGPDSSPEPTPVVSEGSDAPASPGPAQESEPDPEAEHRERVERVLKAFGVYTLTQEDLEQFLGDHETGEVREAKDWGEEDFDALTDTLKTIKTAPPEERTATICRMFNLPTSALEG
jgi:hypothetical protein